METLAQSPRFSELVEALKPAISSMAFLFRVVRQGARQIQGFEVSVESESFSRNECEIVKTPCYKFN
jgi:hypothetical protein